MIYISFYLKNTKRSICLESEKRKLIVQQIFLIQDVFHKITYKHFRFGKLVGKTHIEGTVPHIYYLWHSFCFIKSRKIN